MSDTELLALLTAIAWSKGNTTATEASAIAMEFVLQARQKAKLMADTDRILGREKGE